MNFFDLVNISERYMELINPISPEKVTKIGRMAGLNENSRVIEFGAGYGEILTLWAENFGISGIGIDIRPHVCERARKKLNNKGLNNSIEIVCGKGAEYRFEKNSFDVAACIGSSFVWGGYRPTIQAMREAIKEGGKLIIGEPYWLKERVLIAYTRDECEIHTEHELLSIARKEGFDFEYVIRASHDDWDRYEADNWYGLLRWIEENTDHPERGEVISHLHKIQDEYLKYGREYMGWATYVLNPVKYQ